MRFPSSWEKLEVTGENTPLARVAQPSEESPPARRSRKARRP
jgi:hypothetical protein